MGCVVFVGFMVGDLYEYVIEGYLVCVLGFGCLFLVVVMVLFFVFVEEFGG